MRTLCLALLANGLGAAGPKAGWERALEAALNVQDRSAIEKLADTASAEANRSTGKGSAHYRAAVAKSTLAQLAIETGDKSLGSAAAKAGIDHARKSVELEPNNAEHHRILGTLCGQAIPGNVLSGLKYGRCALDGVDKAIELDPKSARAWLSRGVGNYYRPEAFGGGTGKAIPDLEKAIQLDPQSAEAHLWLGVVLRKAGRNADARKAIERSLSLNPERRWAKQQLEKTPAK